MKLCWFGCGILAVLLALSLLCGMLTQRSTRDAAAALELALDALDRDETAQAVEAGAQARQHWQRHRRFLCAVLSHDELDGIEQGFAELRAYSAVGDAAELRSRCEVLLLQLQHIAQLDAPYAENFLTCPAAKKTQSSAIKLVLQFSPRLGEKAQRDFFPMQGLTNMHTRLYNRRRTDPSGPTGG